MTSQPVKRAAIYARISQADESVSKTDNQEAELRQLAAKNGYEVVAVHVDDDISAFEGKNFRPGFVSLVAGIRDGLYDVVMATEPQRFTRGSAGELEALQVACVKAGAIIHTRAAGIQDPSTPMIRAMLQVQDTLAWLEVAVGRDRQKARNRADRAEGIPNKGVRPYGWEVGGMKVRESEAINVRWAYSAVLDEGMTVWQIAQEFNARGIVTDAMGTMRRTRHDEEKHQVPTVWTTTTIRQLLTRPRNAGILMHEGAELPESKIEPLVTRADWETLRATIKGTSTLRGPKPQYLLGGLIQCTCGARMHASTSVTARKGKPQRRYKIYRCRLYGFDKSQPHVTITQPVADAVVRDWVVESIGLGEDESPAFDRPALAALHARLAEIQAEVARGTDALMEGIGDSARIKGRLKTLAAEGELVEAERDRILGESAHSTALAEFRAALGKLPDLASNDDIDAVMAHGYAAWDALSMTDQRAIIRGGYKVWVTAGGRGMDRVKVGALD